MRPPRKRHHTASSQPHPSGIQEIVMAVIDIAIQPEGRTRVWFDCRDTKPRPGDEERIQRAVSHALDNLPVEDRSQPN
jgi:hypothetical protein